MTANSLGVATCIVSSVIYQVYHSISTYLGPKYLHLPQNENEVRQKVGEFETKYGMHQCFECVDGTHTTISCPLEKSQDYFCYKQFHSLIIQAVFDFRALYGYRVQMVRKCT